MTTATKLRLSCNKCRKYTLHIFLTKEDKYLVYMCSKCKSLKRIEKRLEKTELYKPIIIKIE